MHSLLTDSTGSTGSTDKSAELIVRQCTVSFVNEPEHKASWPEKSTKKYQKDQLVVNSFDSPLAPFRSLKIKRNRNGENQTTTTKSLEGGIL